MEHKGTYYGIEIGEDGWRVTVGMEVLCDGFCSRLEAVRWIKNR